MSGMRWNPGSGLATAIGWTRARMTRPHREIARLGISSCLLGENVRHDGGNKRDTFLADSLSPFVEWVSVCPEEEAGFGTPREPMQLVRVEGSESGASDVRLLTVSTRRDVTDRLRSSAAERIRGLATVGLDGYVFKKNSPSCGLTGVNVFFGAGAADVPEPSGRGLFADMVWTAFPYLPVEEEGRLGDPRSREHFVERAFAHRRLRTLFAGPSAGDLVQFHTRHKLLLLAHAPTAYRELGRLVASLHDGDADRRLAAYFRGFMEAIAIPATRGRHTNVLQHMAGYFDTVANEGDRRELTGTIAAYQRGDVPLAAPVAIVSDYARQYRVQYLIDQAYLEPYPSELLLRNCI